ncbi:DUF4299 family protein [Campylobacter concisus]
MKRFISLAWSEDVAFDAVMVDEIFASASPAAKFDEMMRQVQYLDAYSAREHLYQDKDGNEILAHIRLVKIYRPSCLMLPLRRGRHKRRLEIARYRAGCLR